MDDFEDQDSHFLLFFTKLAEIFLRREKYKLEVINFDFKSGVELFSEQFDGGSAIM